MPKSMSLLTSRSPSLGSGNLRAGLRRAAPKKARKVDFVISQVPHRKQRYETVGDWIPGSPVDIRISKMKDQRYVFLVALHEMIEYELCKKNGISDHEVVAFDVNFEAERRRNIHPLEAEPGNDPRAPYRDEHDFATMIEMMVAQKLGVKWEAYEKTLLSLGPKRRRVAPRPLIRR
ncbi:MAG: hypothetical protein HY296_05110 [Thaumarchaeota archaeon]|nr:hypothetical protein [Nitrososphaerota archaeon]